jgi:IS5 family transposase
MSQIDDFFRHRLDHLIDLRHPLAVLASRMPWQEIEASLAHKFSRQVREGKQIEDIGLFGPETRVVGGGISNAGRPRLPIRLMVSLLYLKHAFNESDEGVVERWAETPTWQYFSGMDYFEHRLPCDATLISKFRRLIGEDGVEELLAHTIAAAQSMKLVSEKQMQTVVVDTTVQEKAIAHPTDSRLLEVARANLVDICKAYGLKLKQTFAKEGQQLSHRAGRYAHAKQFKRMRKAIKRQRTIVNKLMRIMERQLGNLTSAAKDLINAAMAKAARIVAQSKDRKTKNKLYSWHAEEAECISKGKARKPYEFGVKVGIVTTLKGNLIIGARTFPNNPYDGHTLAEQLEQANILASTTIKDVYVDLGYRGRDVEKENRGVSIKHRGKFKSLAKREQRLLKRRQSVEPVIGHLKSDHRMQRCHLIGAEGDALHAVLCATGFNIRWLLRMIRKKGIRLCFALIKLLGLRGLLAKNLPTNHIEQLRRGQLSALAA